MTSRFGAVLALAFLLFSCDNGKKNGEGKPSAAQVSLRGTAFSVSTHSTEKDRRSAPARLARLEGSRGHLLAWPRERFVKLESREARASFDVAFLDRSGKVVDTGLFAQGDPEGLMPRAEAAYALFLPPGSVEKLGVRAGEAAELSPEVRALSPGELPVVRIGDETVYVEMAITAEDRQQGLMYRPRLSADDGMLFVYESEGFRSFWMGNTLLPLDIAFLRSDGTLLNVVETPTYSDPRNPPMSYATSNSDGPAQYVLETNYQWFRRKGFTGPDGKVKPGVKVVLPPEAFRGFPD